MQRITLIGAYPPPTGGIAVHVERLSALLHGQFDVKVLDPYRRDVTSDTPDYVIACGGSFLARSWRLLTRLRSTRSDLIHLHVSSLRALGLFGAPLLQLRGDASSVGMTIHSGSFPGQMMDASRFRRKRIARLIRQCDFLIAVNDDIAQALRDLGGLPEKIVVRPAFIPAEHQQCPALEQQIANLRDGKRAVVVLSGYGLPMYGFHTAIDAIRKNGNLADRCSVVVCMYNSYDEDYVARIQASVERLPSAILFRDLNAEEFSTVLRNADIYVRPTDRDGDAVAIREALWLGKPVIASDCVCRPEGVTLFRLGDVADLSSKFASILMTKRPTRELERQQDVAKEWLAFYANLLGREAAHAGRGELPRSQ